MYATERTPASRDLTLYSVYPHMHLLDHSIEMELINPGGETESLINIFNWDFHWQQNYSFVEPVRIPTGSTIRVHCTFDNSDGNFDNPNHPPKDVTFGELSTDEMCLAMVGFTQ